MAKPTYDELLAVATEYREACCAAMRVIAGIDMGTVLGFPSETARERFIDECHGAGLTDGFGARNDAVLKRAREASHDA